MALFISTAWKMSVSENFLVRIFSHSDSSVWRSICCYKICFLGNLRDFLEERLIFGILKCSVLGDNANAEICFKLDIFGRLRYFIFGRLKYFNFREIKLCHFREITILQFSGDWNVLFPGDWNVLFSRNWNVLFSGD